MAEKTTGQSTKEYFVLFPRHLDRAIDPDILDYYSTNPDKWDYATYPIPRTSFKNIHSGFVGSTNLFKWIEQRFHNYPLLKLSTWSQGWDKIKNTAFKSVELQCNTLFNSLSHYSHQYLSDAQNHISQNRELIQAYYNKANIILFHYNLELATKNGTPISSIKEFDWIRCVGDNFLLVGFPGGDILVPYTVVLCVADKVESYFSFLSYSLLASIGDDRVGLDTYTLSISIYRLLEDAYTDLGNISINLFKALEPLLVGWCLEYLGDEDGMTTLGRMTAQDLITDDRRYDPYIKSLNKIVQDYLIAFGEEGIPFILEQFGQEKLHFYPIINVEEGLIKMYRYGTAYRKSDPEAITEVYGELVKGYVSAYRQIHGSLPPIQSSDSYHPAIQNMIEHKTAGTFLECSLTSNTEWAKLHFDPHQVFTYFPDALDLMDDKAISPHRSSINQIYPKHIREENKLPRPHSIEHTRLVIEMISRVTIDIKAIFDLANKYPLLPFDWTIIILMAKELELKIAARMFSILTFEARMIASTCERNLSQSIFRYFPQQTMSDSGADLKYRIDNLSKLLKGSEGDWVVLHLDLEQWNYTFRETLMEPFVHFFNELFGVKAYNLIMKLFTQSLLISSSRYFPHNSKARFVSWSNHAGGNQGICQKFWTLITIARIRSVMCHFDYKYNLIGSGDNQVLLINIKSSEMRKSKVEQILLNLKEGFDAIGLGVKLYESWYSASLMAYQRKYYFRGKPCPSGIKQAVKAFAGGTDINAGINMHITTAMNGGMSIAENVSNPVIGPLYAYLESYIYILLSPKFQRTLTLTIDSLVAISLCCSELGGLPFLQLTNFLYCGHKDKLGECLSLLRMLWDQNVFDKGHISAILDFKTSEITDEVLMQLVLNPLSLNIQKPMTPESVIKSSVEEFLKNNTFIRNKQLKDIFSLLDEHLQITFAKDLLKISPINLSVLHTLYESSSIGQALHMLNRFNRVTSIARLVARGNDSNQVRGFREKIDKADTATVSYLIKKLLSFHPIKQTFFDQAIQGNSSQFSHFCTKNSIEQDCVFSLRLFLTSWTYGLGDKICLGPFIPPPSEQLCFKEQYTEDDLKTSIVISPHELIPQSIALLERTLGPHKMYIGSRTSDSVKTIKLINLNGIDAGSAVKTYLKLHAWFKAGSSDPRLLTYLEDQICKRVPDLRELIPYMFSGIAGGTMLHRYEALGFVSGCYINSRSNVSTHYFLTTNAATEIQRGDNDRFIFYQSLFQYILGALRFCTPYRIKLVAKINIDHCGYKTPSIPFSLPENAILTELPLIEGLMITGDTLKALKIEAAHQQSLLNIDMVKQLSMQECLCSYISHQLSCDILFYNIKGHSIHTEDIAESCGQGKYNVTVLRCMDLPLFLTTLPLMFLALGTMKCGFSRSQLYKEIRIRTFNPTTLTDYTPYRFFLEAFTVAGRLIDLCEYTNTPYIWKKGNKHTQVLQMLYQGMLKAMDQHREKPFPVPLLVEAKTTLHSYKNIYRAARGWSGKLRKKSVNQLLIDTPFELIRRVECDKNIKLVIVPTRDVVIEKGRYLMTIKEDISGRVLPAHQLIPLETIQTLRRLAPWGRRILKLSNTLISYPPYSNQQGSDKNIIRAIEPWISKIGKWLYSSSSSRLKLLEILIHIEMKLDDTKMIISLADGSGSQLSTLMHLFPNAKGFHNTKFHPEELPGFQSINMIPPSCICPCGIKERIINLKTVWKSNGDLLLLDTWNQINTLLENQYETPSILTWDMESRLPNIQVALEFLYDFIFAKSIDVIIIKFYIPTEDTSILDPLVKIINKYHNSFIIKPSYSMISTQEVYLVAYNFIPFRLYLQLMTTELFKQYLDDLVTEINNTSLEGWEETIFKQIKVSEIMRPCLIIGPFSGLPFTTAKAEIMQYFQYLVDISMGYALPKELSSFGNDPSFNHMTKGKTMGAASAIIDTKVSWLSIIAALIMTQLTALGTINNLITLPIKNWVSMLRDLTTIFPIIGENKEITTLMSRKIGCALSWIIGGITHEEFSHLGWVIHLLRFINPRNIAYPLNYVMPTHMQSMILNEAMQLDDKNDLMWDSPIFIYEYQMWILRHFQIMDQFVRQFIVRPLSAESKFRTLIQLPPTAPKSKWNCCTFDLGKIRYIPNNLEKTSFYIFISDMEIFTQPITVYKISNFFIGTPDTPLYVVFVITN